MEHTTKATEKAAKTTNHNKHQPYLRQLPPFFIPGECCQIYWQTGHCETRRANHCCGSVSYHCQGPWNTPQRQQKAATTANHNKHQPYLRQVPPFFHSWRV